MKDITKLFDYFKRAFHLNTHNRRLYLPQIVLILINACLFIAFGIFIYRVMAGFRYSGFSEYIIIKALIDMAWWIGGWIVFGILSSVVLEAGIFNMYRVCIIDNELISGEFFQGVRKNFLRFFLADIIMLVVWLLILIPYIIVGFLSLMTGFVLIPLMISVFTTMWKVSMVVEDVFVIEGFKRGFHFAVDHFIPLSILVIIRESFLNFGNGSYNSSSSGKESSSSSSKFFEDLPGDMDPSDIPFSKGYIEALPYIKMGFYILIPVVTVAIIVGSLVRMVFKIFFGLTSFVMYVDNANRHVDESSWEVE